MHTPSVLKYMMFRTSKLVYFLTKQVVLSDIYLKTEVVQSNSSTQCQSSMTCRLSWPQHWGHNDITVAITQTMHICHNGLQPQNSMQSRLVCELSWWILLYLCEFIVRPAKDIQKQTTAPEVIQIPIYLALEYILTSAQLLLAQALHFNLSSPAGISR